MLAEQDVQIDMQSRALDSLHLYNVLSWITV